MFSSFILHSNTFDKDSIPHFAHPLPYTTSSSNSIKSSPKDSPSPDKRPSDGDHTHPHPMTLHHHRGSPPPFPYSPPPPSDEDSQTSVKALPPSAGIAPVKKPIINNVQSIPKIPIPIEEWNQQTSPNKTDITPVIRWQGKGILTSTDASLEAAESVESVAQSSKRSTQSCCPCHDNDICFPCCAYETDTICSFFSWMCCWNKTSKQLKEPWSTINCHCCLFKKPRDDWSSHKWTKRIGCLYFRCSCCIYIGDEEKKYDFPDDPSFTISAMQ